MIEIINEANYKDLKSDVDKATRSRASHLSVEFVGIDDEGNLIFETTTDKKTKYERKHRQLIELDYESVRGGNYSDKQKINLMVTSGDIKVHCDCPSWRYNGFQYIGTQLDYSINPENREPVIRNPQLRGTLCKHLSAVVSVLPMNLSSITKSLSKSKFLRED